MNIPVMCFQMSFDASFILVQLAQGGATPLLRLHNSPASEVNSQSQVEVDVNEGEAKILFLILCFFFVSSEHADIFADAKRAEKNCTPSG